MQEYHYIAVNRSGEQIEGIHHADDEASVIDFLHRQGHYPVDIKKIVTASSPSTLISALPFFKGKPSLKQLHVFTQNMAILQSAGLDLEHTLQQIVKTEKHPGLRRIASSLYHDLQDGKSLSKSLTKFVDIFGDFYITIVRSGEASGQLAAAFARLSEHLEKYQKTRNSLISSLTYPCLLVLIAILSVVFLMIFVIPQFIPMFAGDRSSLPHISRVVFSLSEHFTRYAGWLLMVLAVSTYSLFLLYGKQRLKLAITAFLLRIPLTGTLIRLRWSALFARTMATLLNNKLTMTDALELSKNTIPYPPCQEELQSVITDIKNGYKLSNAIQRCSFLPEMGTALISIGEEAGKLPDIFSRLASMYEDDVENQLKRLLVLLEPLLILGLGLMIAVLIIAVLSAMLSMNELVF